MQSLDREIIQTIITIVRDTVRMKNVLQEEALRVHECGEMFCQLCFLKDKVNSNAVAELREEFEPIGTLKVYSYELFNIYNIMFFFNDNEFKYECLYSQANGRNVLQLTEIIKDKRNSIDLTDFIYMKEQIPDKTEIEVEEEVMTC